MGWKDGQAAKIIELLARHDDTQMEFETVVVKAEAMLADETITDEEKGHLNYQLGRHYLAANDWERTEKHWKDCLELNQKVFGENHPYTASANANLGDLYVNAGIYPSAVTSYLEAVRICEEHVGTETAFAALTYRKLGGIYRVQEQYSSAILFFTKAMATLEKQDTYTDILADVYLNLGEMYLSLESLGADILQDAEDYLNKSLELFCKTLGEEHEVCQYLQEQIAHCNDRFNEINKQADVGE